MNHIARSAEVSHQVEHNVLKAKVTMKRSDQVFQNLPCDIQWGSSLFISLDNELQDVIGSQLSKPTYYLSQESLIDL